MSELRCTIAGKPMYWTPVKSLSSEQKAQHASHEDDYFKLEGVISFMGTDASIYGDDYGQQEYFYLDGVEGADPQGYGCGSFNFNWETEVAYMISRLRGRKLSFEELTDITYPGSSVEIEASAF